VAAAGCALAAPRAEPPATQPTTRTSGWAQFKGKSFTVIDTNNRRITGTLSEPIFLDGDTYLIMQVTGMNVSVNTRQIATVEGLP